MTSRAGFRVISCFTIGFAFSPSAVAAPAVERTLSSMVGGAVGGFGGIVVALPKGGKKNGDAFSVPVSFNNLKVVRRR
jgi:hypothetical protein